MYEMEKGSQKGREKGRKKGAMAGGFTVDFFPPLFDGFLPVFQLGSY